MRAKYGVGQKVRIIGARVDPANEKYIGKAGQIVDSALFVKDNVRYDEYRYVIFLDTGDRLEAMEDDLVALDD